jgi:hypothetical protein
LNHLLVSIHGLFSVPLQWHTHSALPQTWKDFGCTLSCRICCNTWTAIRLCLQLTYSNIITLQETISHKGVLLNTVQASSMLKFLHTKVNP